MKDEQERTKLVAYFITERERIRLKKLKGEPQPWSKDEIFQKYRFCNVRREDDRVTQWLKLHWRDPYYNHHNITLAMTLARFLNWPPTLFELGFPEQWKPEHVLKVLKARRTRGEQVWNGAYMITTCNQEIDKLDHLVSVLNQIDSGLYNPVAGDTLELAWLRLRQVYGIGSFLAAQIIADLKFISHHPLLKAKDWWTWAAPGNGSRRGLSWWAELDKPLLPKLFLYTLNEMAGKVTQLIPKFPKLSAQDWQSIMCEVDKYVRAATVRRPKQRYQTTARIYKL